ncbi:MAG: response regulator [Anaerolineales bacterium]
MAEIADQRTDLPQAIEKAVAEAAGLAGDKPVTVVAEYPAHLPAVRVGKHQVVQMISGAIGHAVMAIDEGEVTVSAEIQPDPQDGTGPWAVVNIRLPASPAVGQQALDLAMALKDDASDDASDDEADLPSVRKLAQSRGGDLWLDGPESERPRLRLSLPLLATQRGEGDIRSIVESHLAPEKDTIETLLILVEDPERLEMMSEELGEEGYRVASTTKGREVLALAREENPDLILLDMLSRDPGALEVATVLKQDHRTLNIPVLFLTSMSDPQEGEERLAAASFLVRPSGTAALVSTIQAVLGAGVSPAGRVLVVEQDDATREQLVVMIQSYGYRVTEAVGPEEGLALAEHIPPELVLVNAMMAQERDYWLLRGLRQLGHPFDIFVLANALSEEEGRAAVDRGASGYSETGKLGQLLDQVRKQRDQN